MSGSAAWWRFLPPGAEAGGTPAGRGALSRALRSARAELGASRAARRLEAQPGAKDDLLALRLLLVAPVQPRSLVDALVVAIAIAGLAAEVETVDGFPALAGRLAGKGAASDLVLLVEPPGGSALGPMIAALAEEASRAWRAPVAMAGFEAGLAASTVSPLRPGIERLAIAVDPAEAFDRRFAASFGAILAAPAADRLADAAAAWAARRTGRVPKLVLTDLDGTLWGGILGERAAGEPLPPVHAAYAGALAALGRRGFVLGIASRNDPADVASAIADGGAAPLSPEDFAVSSVGWADKASLVGEALDALGLAAEHTVFIDDDPVNCAGVAVAFPEMDVRWAGVDMEAFAQDLAADPLLFGEPDAAPRAAQYRARAGVERLRAEAPDRAAFLAALRTRLTFVPLGDRTIARGAELASRVNQFLLRDRRPSVADLAARASPFDVLVRLDDAFGAHGLVALVLAELDGDALVVDNLFLSCRALERRVEDAMLQGLGEAARKQGARRIVGRVQALPRNEPARRWIEGLAPVGFDGTWVVEIPPDGAADPTLPAVAWAGDDEGGTR